MVGLDAAGKTTILYKLKLGEIVTTIPTIGEVYVCHPTVLTLFFVFFTYICVMSSEIQKIYLKMWIFSIFHCHKTPLKTFVQ